MVPSLCSLCTLQDVLELQVSRPLTTPPSLGAFIGKSALESLFMAGRALEEKVLSGRESLWCSFSVLLARVTASYSHLWEGSEGLNR